MHVEDFNERFWIVAKAASDVIDINVYGSQWGLLLSGLWEHFALLGLWVHLGAAGEGVQMSLRCLTGLRMWFGMRCTLIRVPFSDFRPLNGSVRF